MANNKLYKAAASNVKKGKIVEFRELELVIPRDMLRTGMGITKARINKLLGDGIGRIRIEEIMNVAELLKVDPVRIMNIVSNQFLKEKDSQQ